MRIKINLILNLFLLFFVAVPAPTFAVIRTIEGTVTAVSDGDTLKIETSDGTKLKIRCYGYDAPETEKINNKTGGISKPGQPMGEEAMKNLSNKVLHKRVKLDIIDIDKYKRMVSMIWLANRNINLEMVKEGMGEAYRKYLKEPYRSEFLEAERHTKAAKKGIWSLANYEHPSDFRKRIKLRGH